MIVFFCILSWKKYEAETPGYIHQHFNPMMIDNVQKSIKAVSHHMATSESHSQLPKNHESPGHPVTRSPGRWAPGGSLPSRSTRILQPWHGVLPASTVEQVAFLESSPRQQGLGIAMGQA